MFVDSADNCTEEEQKLRVFIRRFTRLEQVHACICGDRPVIVLAASVYARERLLMKQTGKPVLGSNFFIISIMSWLLSVAVFVVV